jgi:phosphonate transport system substrate-binding protein
MTTRRTLLAVFAASGFVLATSAAYAQTIKEINFGIISTESSQNLRTQWEPLLKDMEKAVGVPVRPFFAPDYAGVIEGMRFGKVDVGWFGNKSAMEAVDRAGGEIFAQQVYKDGSAGYYSLLIVHKDSEIRSLKDILANPGKYTFGNGDPNSTSGFLVPSYYVFALNKAEPKTLFKRVVSASHEVNALAVANKQVDVATNNSEQLGDPDDAERLKNGRFWKSMPDKAAQIRVIWKSPLIPSDPIVYRANLDPATKKKVRDFFVSYGKEGPNKEQELKILAGIASGLAPFRPSDNDQLLPIRQLELFRDRTKVAADERMDPAEKQKRLSEIDKELDALNKRMEEKKAS